MERKTSAGPTGPANEGMRSHGGRAVEPAFLRIPDFVVWSGLSAPTFHRLCRKGVLRKVKIGGVSLICMASARALFASGYRGSVR
jgi:hypothetical protein